MAAKKSKLNGKEIGSAVADDGIKDLLEKLYDDMSDDDKEKAECVPNGDKVIDCFICGAEMKRIHVLREHMKQHASPSNYDLHALKKAPIYHMLNPKALAIETSVMRDFLVQEINSKRHSQFYGILNEADVELHISDSETDDDGDNDGATEKRPPNVYKCDVCAMTYQRRYEALFHQKTAHTTKELRAECHACGRRFCCPVLVLHHLYTRCESDENPISVVDRFRQYLVKNNVEQFRSLAEAREELKQHRLSTAERLYECNLCNKSFLRSEHLTRHKAVHMPDEHKLACPVCAKRFNRRDNLRTHMKVHLDAPNARLCHNCGHYSQSCADFAMHMSRCTATNNGTPQLPIRRKECGQSVSDLRAPLLTTHVATGTHACHTCGKTFASKCTLTMHFRVHTGPFHCKYCAESFLLPNELTNHLRRHVGEHTVASTTAVVRTSGKHQQTPPETLVAPQEAVNSNMPSTPPLPPFPLTLSTDYKDKAQLDCLFTQSWQ